MQYGVLRTNMLVLGSIASAIVLFGVSPSHNRVTSPIELGLNVWAEDILGSVEDWEALKAIYHALGGDEWNHNDGWLTGAPLKDWYGVRTDKHRGRVIFLELDDNNLTGEIPEEIGKLDSLSSLDLRWNAITGGLENLKNLPELHELKLSANQFSGNIPEALGELTNLKRLDLSENQFSGAIPSLVGNLMRLQSFAAHSNQLSGEIPEEMCYPYKLTRLVLSDNELSGSISDTLMNCEALQHLNLANNQFEGNIPDELISANRFNWLDLRGNKFVKEKQSVFQIHFPGLDIHTKHVGGLNGLAVWGRGSMLHSNEENRLAELRYLSAISVDEGLLSLNEDLVPKNSVARQRDSIDFMNSYLQKSGSRIDTVSDIERMLAKANQHALTNTLQRLEATSNFMIYGPFPERWDPQDDSKASQ